MADLVFDVVVGDSINLTVAQPASVDLALAADDAAVTFVEVVGPAGSPGVKGDKGDKGDPGTTLWSDLTGTRRINIPIYVTGYPDWAPQGVDFFVFNQFGEFLSLAGYGIAYDGNVANTSFAASEALWLTSGRGGSATHDVNVKASGSGRINMQSPLTVNGSQISSGAGSPEGTVTANVGSLYLRTDGGTGSTLYVKESGTGNTGWAAK